MHLLDFASELTVALWAIGVVGLFLAVDVDIHAEIRLCPGRWRTRWWGEHRDRLSSCVPRRADLVWRDVLVHQWPDHGWHRLHQPSHWSSHWQHLLFPAYGHPGAALHLPWWRRRDVTVAGWISRRGTAARTIPRTVRHSDPSGGSSWIQGYVE